jgi:hypothetical protein
MNLRAEGLDPLEEVLHQERSGITGRVVSTHSKQRGAVEFHFPSLS